MIFALQGFIVKPNIEIVNFDIISNSYMEILKNQES
jgi:hypothetical protein